MGHKQRKRVRNIISAAFILFIVASEYVLLSIIEFKVGFLNTTSLRKAASETTYANVAESYFEAELDDIMEEYGLPSYLSTKLENNAGIYNRIHSNLEKSYSGIVVDDEYDEIIEILDTMLEPYVSSGVITESQLSEIDGKIDILCKEAFGFEFGNELNELNSEYYGRIVVYSVAAAIVLVLSILCIWFLYDLKHRAVRVFFYATCINTIFNIVLTMFVAYRKNTYVATFDGKIVQDTVRAYYNCSLNAFYAGTAICIIICIISGWLVNRIKSKY
jgi:hypothetical protein